MVLRRPHGVAHVQGIELVAQAIRSGIYNDLGSGSNVDLCIITKGKVGQRSPFQ